MCVSTGERTGLWLGQHQLISLSSCDDLGNPVGAVCWLQLSLGPSVGRASEQLQEILLGPLEIWGHPSHSVLQKHGLPALPISLAALASVFDLLDSVPGHLS